MASKVFIVGNGFQGIIEFEKPNDAKNFYFNNCPDKAYTLMVHDKEPYKQRDKLVLMD